ncbi:putative E3 ubiquitin ligase [Handroanthus impetiginosus]|uniref:RING-type E3 ubiquitin transferase n=1 Tax=Handroanthus impetiginosus TaxID=429701 RepID=A0A2G9G1Z6_9LAMI|nr:putative E3 ubiquitin ligase [Handroanthus impetiginosus]
MEIISVGGVTCCLGAAALYFIGREWEREAEVLNSVTRVKKLKDLAELLSFASKAWPLLVTASGKVGSDAPIKCKYSGLRGVIVEERTEHHFLKCIAKGSWIQDSEFVSSTCKEVPWYLDDGTDRVHVVRARSASGLVLPARGEVFEESNEIFLGVKRIECLLPTGKHLTIVGEAVKDDTGSVYIRRPPNGPFYVSDCTIDQLIKDNEAMASFCKFASKGFAVVGVYLLANHAIRYITRIWRLWSMRKRALAAAAKNAAQKKGGLSGQPENGSDNASEEGMKPDLCVICVEREYNSVLLPCGHMCCCMPCSLCLKTCPLCRRQIAQIVRTFRS